MTRWSLQKHFVLYSILSITFLALLVWWIYYQVREGARLTAQQEVMWKQEITSAHHWMQDHLNDCEEFRQWLATAYPDLELSDTGQIVVQADARKSIERLAAKRVRMFASEGAFLILLLIAGVTYVFWTMRKEVIFERRQSTFLAATSHELKTQITSLRLYLDTLRERKLPEEKQREILETMQQDIERLTDLIDRLLQAQAVMGRTQKTPRDIVNLTEETEAALVHDRFYLEHQGFAIQTEMESDLFAIANPNQWQLIVKNLMENASKYAGDSRKIYLRLFKEGKRARLEVQDFGIGIDAIELDRIFERFYRIGNEDTRATRGTGLGLYLVRATAETFGGRAFAVSDGPGKGSTFVVELPLSKDTQHA
jgi:signal transduction histidine kinase